MKIAIALLTALLSTVVVAEGTSGHTCNSTDTCMHVGARADSCPTEAVLPDGGCMDPDIMATQLEYFAELVQACDSDNPSADRNVIMLEIGVLLNLSKFIPEVGFNGLTPDDVAAIRNETTRIVPQYETMKSNLEAHTCN